MNHSDVFQRIGEMGIIPVVKIEDADCAVPMMNALIDGGLPCAEITLRTSAAYESILRIKADNPSAFLGAGTVLNLQQAKSAIEAGAQFIVSPGFDPSLAHWCASMSIAYTPGVSTATEITSALKENLTILKFFPAEELGGINMVKALSAPFSEVKFIPTGGVNSSNLANYLSLASVWACGGSWLVKSEDIVQRKYDKITHLAAEAVRIVQEVRGKKI